MKIFRIAILMMFIMTCTTVGVNAEISDTVNNLSWNYYKTLDKDENIFYSPYSISAALSILANGATGDTRREILSALSSKSVGSLNRDFDRFRNTTANSHSNANVLKDANLILIDQSIIGNGINPTFKNTVEKYYNAEIAQANFSGNLTGERQRISNWVDKNTNHFIPNYKSAVEADTIVDLLNVIYFKGDWQRPFDADDTYDLDFTNKDGSQGKVKMMVKNFNRNIQYYADDKYRAVALPYKPINNDTNIAMYIILPTDKSNLNIAETWDAESIAYKKDFIAQINNAPISDSKINVWLPKFEMDIRNDLTKNLQAMGITRAFTDDANFYKIVRNTQLKIDSAIHQAKVKVDEKGTEAAAVTEFVMVATSAAGFIERPVEFHVDIPFLFVIREVNSGIDLFTGVVNNLK